MIPVTEDDSGKLKFQVFHLKTAISYFIWCIIPTSGTVCQRLLLSLSWEQFFALNILNLADKCMFVTTCALPFLLPGLMANLVEKSESDLNTITKLNDFKIKIALGISVAVFNLATTLYIFQSMNLNNFPLMVLLNVGIYFSISFEMICLLLVIQTVSDLFERRILKARKIDQVGILTAKHLQLVQLFRKIKEGLSPILFNLIMLFGLTGLLLFYSIKPYLPYGHIMPLIYFVNGFCLLSILYNITSKCERIYGCLFSNNTELR